MASCVVVYADPHACGSRFASFTYLLRLPQPSRELQLHFHTHCLYSFVRSPKERRRPQDPITTPRALLEESAPAETKVKIGHLIVTLEHSHFHFPCQQQRARSWSWKTPLMRPPRQSQRTQLAGGSVLKKDHLESPETKTQMPMTCSQVQWFFHSPSLACRVKKFFD